MRFGTDKKKTARRPAGIILAAALCFAVSPLSGCGADNGGSLTVADSINEGRGGQYALEYTQGDALTLASYLTDGMTAQAEKPFRVAGLGRAGAAVTATLKDADGGIAAEISRLIPGDGSFVLTLPARAASYEPYALTVTSDGAVKSVEDLLFGEVYIAAGQSNMAYTVADERDTERYISQATDNVRFYNLPSWPDQGTGGQYPLRPQFRYSSAI